MTKPSLQTGGGIKREPFYGNKVDKGRRKAVQMEDSPSKSSWWNVEAWSEVLLIFFALSSCSPLCLLPICPAETKFGPVKFLCLIRAKIEIRNWWPGRSYTFGVIWFSTSCLIFRGTQAKKVCPPADLSHFQKKHPLSFLPQVLSSALPSQHLLPSNSGERERIRPRLTLGLCPVEGQPRHVFPSLQLPWVTNICLDKMKCLNPSNMLKKSSGIIKAGYSRNAQKFCQSCLANLVFKIKCCLRQGAWVWEQQEQGFAVLSSPMLMNIGFCISQPHYSQTKPAHSIQEAPPKGQVSAAVYILFLRPTYQETQVDYIDSLFQGGWSKGLRVLKGQSWLLTAS